MQMEHEPVLSINAPNEFGHTPLNLACYDGDFAKVQELVSRGADVNSISGRGCFTPLHSSSWKNHFEIVKFLIKLGVNINVQNADGFTPLNGAIWNGHEDLVFYLLDNNADVNICNNQGFTPLITAAHRGEITLFRELLQRGANINARDIYGKSALDRAADENDNEIRLQILTECRAYWGKLDSSGRDILTNEGLNVSYVDGNTENNLEQEPKEEKFIKEEP